MCITPQVVCISHPPLEISKLSSVHEKMRTPTRVTVLYVCDFRSLNRHYRSQSMHTPLSAFCVFVFCILPTGRQRKGFPPAKKKKTHNQQRFSKVDCCLFLHMLSALGSHRPVLSEGWILLLFRSFFITHLILEIDFQKPRISTWTHLFMYLRHIQ